MGRAGLLQLVVAGLLLLPGQPEAAVKGRRVVRYRCQYMRTHNRTNIVCAPVEIDHQVPGTTAIASVEPETFNGHRAQREPMCGKLRQLAQRLAPFEDGSWKYCDPASCLRESPHCSHNVVSAECSRCLGRCWLMYAFPGAKGSQSKDFPCDPLRCGTPQLFCGGYKFKRDEPSGP